MSAVNFFQMEDFSMTPVYTLVLDAILFQYHSAAICKGKKIIGYCQEGSFIAIPPTSTLDIVDQYNKKGDITFEVIFVSLIVLNIFS